MQALLKTGIALCMLLLHSVNLSATSFEVTSSDGMVVSQDYLASEVGAQVLADGGNAVDAAIAVAYALTVTHPQAGNITGGGFMMIYDASAKQVYALDYREKAPLNATTDMFLDSSGNPDAHKSRFSALAVGVPGTLAGLKAAHKRFGSKALSRLIEPAIMLAENGILVTPALEKSLAYFEPYLAKHAATRAIFFHNNKPLKAGMTLVQTDLAQTLKHIQNKGPRMFYRGKIAEQIADYVQAEGGIISKKDFKRYKPKWRKPVIGTYRGYSIYSMPPPSSGGIALITALNILEHFPLTKWGHNSPKTIHITTEALKCVYRDRAKYLGDSDFVKVPQQRLISKDYAKTVAALITVNARLSSEELSRDIFMHQPESNDTTHFVVIDKWGNAVSNTYTLNFSFGNGMIVPGLGLFLNNEMDDFSAKPGKPNAYGLINTTQNSVAAEKRMLSSMTPTIVMKNKTPFLLTGSPGGSRIITTTLQVIQNVIDHNMSLNEAVQAPRFHHQLLPDTIYVEPKFNKTIQDKLTKRGYSISPTRRMGAAQSILVKPNMYIGVADQRTTDAKAVGVRIKQ